MVDLYNRVERRSLTGTGLAADSEAIEELEATQARFERAWRPPPKKPFDVVLRESREAALARKSKPEPKQLEGNSPSKKETEMAQSRIGALFQTVLSALWGRNTEGKAGSISVAQFPKNVGR